MSAPLRPLSWYKDLTDAAARRKTGYFIVEGERAIRQVAEIQPDTITELVCTGPSPHDLESYPARTVTTSRFKSISSSMTPQGIMAVVRLPGKVYTADIPEKTGDRLLLLEDIQDPGNIGSLIRTAAAFDFNGIIMSGKCADPFSPKCVQSAAGAVLSLWIRRTDNYRDMVRTLQTKSYSLVAATLDGDDRSEMLRADRLLLALGNEAAGISPALLRMADFRFRLPLVHQKAESLNVAVAGGICMYLSTHTI